jgi:hypothetical protein
MKFLLFNIAVIAALAHLFAGGAPDIGAAVDRAMEKVRTVAADSPPAADPTPTSSPADDPRSEPAEPRPPKQVAETAPPPPPPLPEPETVDKPVVHEAPDPATAARRDDVLWGSVAPDLTPDLTPDAFPDAFGAAAAEARAAEDRDRRQALMTLAEDMELFSLEQLSQ